MIRFWKSKNIENLMVVAGVSAMLISCSSEPATTDVQKTFPSIDSFKEIKVDTTITLFASYAKPDCHLQLKFQIPSSASSKKSINAVNSLIGQLSQEGNYLNESNDLDEMVRQYTKAYIVNYLEEGNDAIANYGDDMEAAANWMSYEENCEGSVLYNDYGIFSYSVKLYTYTGGAHGNSSNCVGSINLNNNRTVTLESLFDQDNKETIKGEILEILAQEHQLLNDEIEATENFYISDKGITFVYDEFEIASYSDGEISVTLGWDKIKPLLLSKSSITGNPIIEL